VSSGDAKFFDDKPGSFSKLVALRRAHPELATALRRARIIDKEHDIPYIGGSSQCGGVIYIDRHLPDELIQGDIVIHTDKFIELHEVVEYTLVKLLALKARIKSIVSAALAKFYEPTHHLATAAEAHALELDFPDEPGIYKIYTGLLRPYYRPIEGEKLKVVPPDLALYPYQGDELDLIVKLGSRNRFLQEEVDYKFKGDDAPRRCGRCVQFGKTLETCRIVRGHIEPDYGCDRYLNPEISP
jgi:hypothetical protein